MGHSDTNANSDPDAISNGSGDMTRIKKTERYYQYG